MVVVVVIDLVVVVVTVIVVVVVPWHCLCILASKEEGFRGFL